MLVLIDNWAINTDLIQYAVANKCGENPADGFEIEIQLRGKNSEAIIISRNTLDEAYAVLRELSDASSC